MAVAQDAAGQEERERTSVANVCQLLISSVVLLIHSLSACPSVNFTSFL